MLYQTDYMMQAFLHHHFQVLSVNEVHRTHQLCQIYYYMGLEAHDVKPISLVWHELENKPCMHYCDAFYVVPVGPEATLREALTQMGFGQCTVKCIESVHDMDTLIEMPVPNLPLFQLNIFFSLEISVAWYQYWIQEHEWNVQYLNELLAQCPQQTEESPTEEGESLTHEEEMDHICYRTTMAIFE